MHLVSCFALSECRFQGWKGYHFLQTFSDLTSPVDHLVSPGQAVLLRFAPSRFLRFKELVFPSHPQAAVMTTCFIFKIGLLEGVIFFPAYRNGLKSSLALEC